jgi:hypothetical protein
LRPQPRLPKWPRIGAPEFVRWALCFAVVVAAHGLGAMAIMDNASEESEFGVDTPVVVIDLPESFITSPAPMQDLPPGPLRLRGAINPFE